MRETIGLAAFLILWIVGGAVWYFWLSQTIWGFLAGLLVLVAVPAWAAMDR